MELARGNDSGHGARVIVAASGTGIARRNRPCGCRDKGARCDEFVSRTPSHRNPRRTSGCTGAAQAVLFYRLAIPLSVRAATRGPVNLAFGGYTVT